MNVRIALVLGSVVLVAASPSGEAQSQARNAQRPNVVLIITDDVGYGDLGSYGAPDIKTPHIDGLARDGVRLTDFYANGATCTPTRAGLISGRYQQRFGLEDPLGAGGPADLERGLSPTGRSLPQLLKGNGYATALVGKWHLGWKAEFSPGAHGFDHFFGFKNGFTDFYHRTDGDGRADLFENDRPVEVPGYMTDLITERSVQFIEQNARRPFFIDVAYNAAHWPYQVPDKPSKARNNARHVVWEGGIRVPAILRWPGHIPAGRVSGQVGITMDLTASILAATHTPVPVDAHLEGIDLFPVLEGRAPAIERTLFWRVVAARPQRAVRSGDWKLIFDGPRPLLFNLRTDIGERNDVIGAHSDIARRLRTLLAAWQADVDVEARRATPR